LHRERGGPKGACRNSQQDPEFMPETNITIAINYLVLFGFGSVSLALWRNELNSK
jgi:hypothetical protein